MYFQELYDTIMRLYKYIQHATTLHFLFDFPERSSRLTSDELNECTIKIAVSRTRFGYSYSKTV